MKGPRQDLPAMAQGGIPAGDPAALVAASVVNRLQHIAATLAPVIGQGGVTALYERSRHLSSRSHPWLAAPENGLADGMKLEELKLLIARQDDSEAAAGAAFLLKCFHGVLAGLVGNSLTEQLIGPTPGGASEADSVP